MGTFYYFIGKNFLQLILPFRFWAVARIKAKVNGKNFCRKFESHKI